MKQNALLPWAVATPALILGCLASPKVEQRQDGGEDAAARAVCQPPVTDPDAQVPPCSNIEFIETMCWPKGEEAIHYDGHAQCMCKGSFFAEWVGCQNCLKLHGFRNEREVEFYTKVLDNASKALCDSGATPTAPFRSLFTEAEKQVVPVTTGDTAKEDKFPGDSAISLYYTATGSQGTGEITGPAATVTRAGGLATAPAGPLGNLATGNGNGGPASRTSNGNVPEATTDAEDESPAGDSGVNSTRGSSTLSLVVALTAMAVFAAWS